MAVAVYEEDLRGKDGVVAKLDKALRGVLRAVIAAEEFKAKAEQSLTLHTHQRIKASRLLLVGLGSRKASTEDKLDIFRDAASRAVKSGERAGAKSVAFSWEAEELAAEARAVAEGALLGSYRYDRYKSDKKPARVATVTLLQEKKNAAVAAADLGAATGEAVNLARDLVNEPPSSLTPKDLAEAATTIAKEVGLKIEVHGRGTIEELKMGMFLGVTRGSEEKPQLIHLWYVPKEEDARARPPLALVGKAITFDSGGLDLKTAEGMLHMKTDMAGSAAVFAAMRVIAKLAPPFPVHAFVGACENMPSGNAYKPGDVLVSRAGITAEVGNTDAEGRLVLGDVLTWACEHKPYAVIDLATLTGACVVALGPYTIGAMSNDDAFAQSVLNAAKTAGEDAWRLPLTPSLEELIKSSVADVKNTGGRYGGAITAGLFLKKFVGKTPWVHLDIAGPSYLEKDHRYDAKGATGVGVRTLVELVKQRMVEEKVPAPPLGAK